MDPILSRIYSNILLGQHKEVADNVKDAIQQGIPPSKIMSDGMIMAMSEVGRLFETGEYYVPEMLIAARAMKSGMDVLRPYLSSSETHPSGKIAIGTVKGDFHDIGKNLVKMMLEGAGFEVIELGVDVSPEVFVSAASNLHVDIIAMSALITTTMPAMRPVIELLEINNLRPHVKILVGGAPLTQAFADRIDADGYAPDASRAVACAKNILSTS